MIAETRTSAIIAASTSTRRWRRFVAVPVLTPRLGLATAGLAAAAWTGAGVWAGFVVVALGVGAGTVLTAATVLVLLAGVGAGSLWAEVRAALAEPRSWSLFAQMGTRPRTYLIGRLLVTRAARLGAACCGALSTCATASVLRPEALTPAHWALIPLAAGGGLSVGVLHATVRLERIRRASPTRAVLLPIAVVGALVASCWWWAASWLPGPVEALLAGTTPDALPAVPWPRAAVLGAACVACAVLAATRFHRAGALTWSTVTTRSDLTGPRAPRRPARTGGARVLVEVMLLDLRRAIRAFEWRVRPAAYLLLSLAVSAALLGAMASWILADGAEALLASDVGATLAGGVTAGYVLIVWTTASAWSSLDSDRGGTVLMRSLPHGIRILAAARAASGAFVIGAAGLLLLGVLCAFAPLGPRAVGTAASACATVALLAPTLGCWVSLRHPHTEWKEVGEIGRHGWARSGITYLLGAGMALTTAVASGRDWTAGEATAVALASALLTPLVAAGVTATLPTRIGVGHARG
ncbi:hypothetical protein ACMT9Y_01585 [Clavibacter tessellarius]|uniref:hypothetical protein n=1 Tax=Clavibacter tessellarius TaxID=31965 RepID=UPI0039E74FAE